MLLRDRGVERLGYLLRSATATVRVRGRGRGRVRVG